MSNTTTQETGKTLLHDIDKLKRNAAQVVQDAREHANAHVDETKQRVTDTIESVRENLVTHPLSLLGIGFAVGLLLGLRIRS
jgi:ElaB/YqjD/DUF883 family membrane-anchored ribosome-binding protein